MKKGTAARQLLGPWTLCVLALALLLGGCASNGIHVEEDTGIKASDPHLIGARDMHFDHLIVPGERIGPVPLGGLVSAAVQHLGEPDRVDRSTYRGPGYDADEVYYYYNDDCMRFTWIDKGVNPRIEDGWRGINVSCPKWHTAGGIHVGSSIRAAAASLGTYCAKDEGDGGLDSFLVAGNGIWFWSKDRNSPVSEISVVPYMNDWMSAAGCH